MMTQTLHTSQICFRSTNVSRTFLNHETMMAKRPSMRLIGRNRTMVMVSASAEFAQGAKVKVSAPIKVYHVGKFKEGLDLEGLEGVVQADVRPYNGIELSATLPWKVKFEVPGQDGKMVNVIAHLVRRSIMFSSFSFLLLLVIGGCPCANRTPR